MTQRLWDDVEPGQQLASVAYPLSVMRLVMAAGANRDFNSIHHNADFARALPDFHEGEAGLAEQIFRFHHGGGVAIALKYFRADRHTVSPEEEPIEVEIHLANRTP